MGDEVDDVLKLAHIPQAADVHALSACDHPLIWLSGVLVGVLPELDLQLSPGWASAASVELG